MKTHRGFQWELGKWYKTTGKGDLCSSGWFHFYSDPLVGLFLNPIHANIGNPRLFRAEVKGRGLNDHEAKCRYSRAKLVEELTVPQISNVQRVRFAILCTKEVYKEKKWNEWADNWLSGKDRTKESATIAANTAESEAQIAAKNAFFAAKSAESLLSTFYAAKSTVSTTESAYFAAESAVRGTVESKKIDLIKIARKVIEE